MAKLCTFMKIGTYFSLFRPLKTQKLKKKFPNFFSDFQLIFQPQNFAVCAHLGWPQGTFSGQKRVGPSPDYVSNQLGVIQCKSIDIPQPKTQLKWKTHFSFFEVQKLPLFGPFFTLTLVHKTPIQGYQECSNQFALTHQSCRAQKIEFIEGLTYKFVSKIKAL